MQFSFDLMGILLGRSSHLGYFHWMRGFFVREKSLRLFSFEYFRRKDSDQPIRLTTATATRERERTSEREVAWTKASRWVQVTSSGFYIWPVCAAPHCKYGRLHCEVNATARISFIALLSAWFGTKLIFYSFAREFSIGTTSISSALSVGDISLNVLERFGAHEKETPLEKRSEITCLAER